MGFGDAVAAALNCMRYERKVYKDYLPDEARTIANNLVGATKDLWPDVQDSVLELLRREIPLEAPHAAVWWYSVLIGIKKDADVFLEFVRYVRAHRDAFSANTQYYLLYQMMLRQFYFPELDGKGRGVQEEIWRFYQEIVEEFASQMDEGLLEGIPPDKRDDGLVVVITEQFLGTWHGPTKTALDRCRTLMTVLQKRVLLINDAEVLSDVGRISFWDDKVGIYYDPKNVTTDWKGVTVPYWQCKKNMPDIDALRMLLREIRRMAPGKIVLIGKGGILGNLASRMVPSIAVGLAPSNLEYTCAKYQAVGRPLKESERKMLSSLGFPVSYVIEGVFTSGLKTQMEHVTRQELGIPEEAFVLTVIGGRLDTEVTDGFLSMLEQGLEPDMYLVFWGKFDRYKEKISKFPRLQKQSGFLGFCDDILSRLEVCDLYVNPYRKGGGTSAVEALFKGLPVVTVDYGDVAINVGAEFCVADYGQMGEQIQRYHGDREFYEQMSRKAKMRAERLLDTDGEFVRILEEMDRREQQEQEIKALEESWAKDEKI